jgi:hypothetical protein
MKDYNDKVPVTLQVEISCLVDKDVDPQSLALELNLDNTFPVVSGTRKVVGAVVSWTTTGILVINKNHCQKRKLW